jgi:hypothetical protein
MRIAEQRGQACLEAVAALSLLVLFALAVHLLGGEQHDALARDFNSRMRAFGIAQGQRANDAAAPFDSRSSRVTRQSPPGRSLMQAGGRGQAAGALRKQLLVEDAGFLHVYVGNKHTAILTGAGHAVSDRDTHRRVAGSPTAWGRPAGRSVAIAQRVDVAVSAVDRGWHRPSLERDWLGAWTDLIPEDRSGPSLDPRKGK